MEKEKWKYIKGFHRKYKISSYGNVYSCVSGRMLTWKNRPAGYASVTLGRVNGKPYCVTVHKLVAEAFLGPRPDGMYVCHKDSNPLNNYVGNLYYGGQRSNMIDAFKTDLGGKHSVRKLSDEDVIEIKRRLSLGEKQTTLAEEFNVDNAIICRIKKGKVYSWINPTTF